ncbi:FtsX-like permease family protein [Archangium violaceum]|uniref:ABC transporter permease n=1 Tax=Archangium violaceum Cb vi76 TaxID=1406225 RepID=A0A084SSS3_9BACT|nr:FtsX-like permease family protein [Archangium violaceum]KFA91508.1 hypothetical protein Q664_22180 [Archangium violaceum Cb vi76]
MNRALGLGFALAVRHALQRPMRTLVTLLGIAAGVAGLRAVQLGTQGALDSVKAAFEQAAGTTAVAVIPPGESHVPLPAGTLEAIERVPGVEAALPSASLSTVRVEELAEWQAPLYPGQISGLWVQGVDLTREPGRGRVVPVEGQPLTPGVWLGESYARERGLRPGSTLRLVAPGGEVTFEVRGLLAREGLGARNGGSVLIAPIESVRRAFGLAPEAISEVALVVPDHRIDEVVGRLRETLGEGASVVRPGERGKDVALRMNNMRAGTDLTSSLALFLSAFLIYGLYASAAAERRRETGMLRCVGATKVQAALPLLWEALICSVPGALLGAVLGAPLAAGVAEIFARVAATEARPPPSDPWGAVLVAAAGILVAVLSALIPAIQGARQPPFDAVRARAGAAESPSKTATLAWMALAVTALAGLWLFPPRSSGPILTYSLGLLFIAGCTGALPALIGPMASGMSRIAARWFGGGWALGAAGPRWRPVRSGLAAGAVLCAVAMVGGMSSVALGVRGQMEEWSDRALGWDLFVRKPSGLDEALVRQLQALEGVRRASPVTVRAAQVQAEDGRTLGLSVVGISARAYAEEGAYTVVGASEPDESRNLVRSIEQTDRALVTSVLAEQLGVRAGQRLTLKTPTGPRTLTVSAEIVDYTQNGFAVIVSQVLLEEAFGVEGTDLMALRLEEPRHLAAVERALSAMPGVRSERQASLKQRVLDMVDQALSAMDGLLLLAGVVGLLAVGSAVALSAFERRGDIAALRSLGMARRQVGAMLVAEAVVTAAVGSLGGMVVGMLLAWIFSEATHRMGFPVAFVPPWRALLLASVAALLAALPAAFLPARRAMRISPAEALREG